MCFLSVSCPLCLLYSMSLCVVCVWPGCGFLLRAPQVPWLAGTPVDHYLIKLIKYINPSFPLSFHQIIQSPSVTYLIHFTTEILQTFYILWQSSFIQSTKQKWFNALVAHLGFVFWHSSTFHISPVKFLLFKNLTSRIQRQTYVFSVNNIF